MATPGAFVGFSRQRAMAADGRCKAYSDQADGMSLAEGVGLVLVERLSDARRNGHQVLAVIRGSAVNQDGASNGLTAPNGPSQQRVIRQALANAKVDPDGIDVIDGHGTGTALGDPIEAQALLATYGQSRDPEHPLLLGSVKSNIGHTQMASGVASVIKMVMAMRHATAAADACTSTGPPRTSTGAPAPSNCSPSRSSGRAPDTRAARASPPSDSAAPTSTPSSNRPRRTGRRPTRRAPPPHRPAPAGPQSVPLVLSATTEAGLRAQAGRLLTHVADHPQLPLTDLAFSLATSRSALEHRAAVVADDRDELHRALTRAARRDPRRRTGHRPPGGGGLAFLFTGQGGQRPGMGRELYDRHPVFAEALDAVLARFDRELDRPLREMLFADPGTPEAALLDDTGYTQPALFALEVALFRLAESWGLRPGLRRRATPSASSPPPTPPASLSLEDACTLVAARGRLMAALPSGGAMVSVPGHRGRGGRRARPYEGRASVAAVNGPGLPGLSRRRGRRRWPWRPARRSSAAAPSGSRQPRLPLAAHGRRCWRSSPRRRRARHLPRAAPAARLHRHRRTSSPTKSSPRRTTGCGTSATPSASPTPYGP